MLLSPDEKDIYAITCRGLGAGPNGGNGFIAPPQGTYIGNIQLGSFQKIQMPDVATLKAYTAQTIANTFVERSKTIDNNPLPIDPQASKSPIKYIVYITKKTERMTKYLDSSKQVRATLRSQDLALTANIP